MTCPNCLRDVPKLVGPDYICPDCYLVASEDLIPSLFGGVVDEGRGDDTIPDYLEECLPEFGCEYPGGEPEWPFDDDDSYRIGPSEDPARPKEETFPPTFEGRPRF